jgi:hypothetical protein
MRAARLIASAGMAAIALTPLAAQQPPASSPERFLKAVAGFADADVARFGAGEVIARATTSGSEREVAVVAAVRIRAGRDRVLAYFNQLVMYEDGVVTIQIGSFSRPPVLADVQRLTLPDDDIRALRACKPGNCDVRMGGAAISAFQSAIDWNAPDAAARVNALAREKLAAYMADYASRGNAALVRYDDRATPVSLAEQWRGLLRNSPYFLSYAPALSAHLDQFPKTPAPGATDVLYWAKESYAGRLVVHADHMVTWRDPARPDRVMVAQKQLFASHYLDGSLALTTIVDTPGAAGASADVVYTNRSRSDLLASGIGSTVKRKVAQSQAEKAAVDTLGVMKHALEK